MPREKSFCIVVGSDQLCKPLQRVAALHPNIIVRFTTLDRFDSVLMRSPKGCCWINVDELPHGVQWLAEFFIRNHCAIPIVASSRTPEVRKWMRLGAFDAIRMPEDDKILQLCLANAIYQDSYGNSAPSKMRRKFASLTKREREVIKLFLNGGNAKTIAKLLDVTVQTVDKHRNRALRKFGEQSIVRLYRAVVEALLQSQGFHHTEPSAIPAPHFAAAPSLAVANY